MQIDLKWSIPAVMPVAIVMLCRVVWWVAGAEWTQDGGFVALSAIILGGAGGLVAAVLMHDEGIKWIVGGKK